VEIKRDKSEEKLLAGVLSDDDFVRLREKYKADLDSTQSRIDDLNNQRDFDIEVIQEVLRLTHDIYKAYKTAPYEQKRHYLGLFWEKFLVQDKEIVKAVPTKLIQALQEGQMVIIRSNWLPSSVGIIHILEDFGYLAQLKAKLDIIKQLQKIKKVQGLSLVA
jgi:hypothetical protein